MKTNYSSNVLYYIENKNIDLASTAHYAAILGESPSKGAKSPTLWNAAFNGCSINGFMHPMDVKKYNLGKLVSSLREDERYIGGAVTMPYKIDIISFLDDIEPQAKAIGAVNCVYRRDNKLVGTNTDGAAALETLEAVYGSIKNKKALLLGIGGAGLAVAAYIASALGKDGTLRIANRSTGVKDSIIDKLKHFCNVENVLHWPVKLVDVAGVNIIVNCTSIGFETVKKDEKGYYSLKDYSPLAEIKNIRVNDSADVQNEYQKAAKADIEANQRSSMDILKSAGHPFVFDIIYQPKETTLLRLARENGCRALNGLPMNLEQAVIAFVKANTASRLFSGSQDEIRIIMGKKR